jgi:cysteine desulfurase
MAEELVYLDHAATTPVDSDVLDAMLPYFSDSYGNPSSTHRFGQKAEAAVEDSRETIATLMNCQPKEIIFTSCGSESDNLALRGIAFRERHIRQANHILTTLVEHHAVLKTAEQLQEQFGFEVEYLETNIHGILHPDELLRKVREDTAIVSVMYANNEVGSINPLSDLAQICRDRGIPFHSDAVQAASQLPIDVHLLGVDLMSLGAHKFYGPKGAGVLYVREGLQPIPAQTGGSQEDGFRAGTHNVPLIVGMAKALERTVERRSHYNPKFTALRERIIEAVSSRIPDSKLTGHPAQRLPNHASFAFKDIDGNQLLAALDINGFACSSGSACKTGDPEPSDVLLALGYPADWILGSLRVSVGRSTTETHIDRFIDVLPRLVVNLREKHGKRV